MPRDAQAWLAERGVQREPLRIQRLEQAQQMDPLVPVREAIDLARQSSADALPAGPQDSMPAGQNSPLEESAAKALAFIRASTSRTPQAEGRMRSKLAARGFGTAAIDVALSHARQQRLVDDSVMASALVEEWRLKGHGSSRIQRDLVSRGFSDDLIAEVLAAMDDEDPEAAAFALAQRRASALGAVSSEVAFRRVVHFVARRGYPDGLARKVARQAVFVEREEQRTAEH